MMMVTLKALTKNLGRQSWLSNEALFQGGEVTGWITAEARLEPSRVVPRRDLLAEGAPGRHIGWRELRRAEGVEPGSYGGDYAHGPADNPPGRGPFAPRRTPLGVTRGAKVVFQRVVRARQVGQVIAGEQTRPVAGRHFQEVVGA